VPAHVVVVQHVDGGREDVVARGPQPGAHADLLAHEDPGQEGVEGHLVQELGGPEEEAGRHEGRVSRHRGDGVVEGHGRPQADDLPF
jgi:hypothetical protein